MFESSPANRGHYNRVLSQGVAKSLTVALGLESTALELINTIFRTIVICLDKVTQFETFVFKISHLTLANQSQIHNSRIMFNKFYCGTLKTYELSFYD